MITHPLTGKPLPLVLTPRQAGELLGITAHTARDRCARGEIPTLPHTQRLTHWRIPTAKLLAQLGLDIRPAEVTVGVGVAAPARTPSGPVPQ